VPEQAGGPEAALSAAGAAGSSWLPLLRSLTAVSPEAGVWKNADPALAGEGDIDFSARRSDWDEIIDRFHDWASERGLAPAVVCRHAPDTMFLLAVQPGAESFLQLDVRSRVTFRGSTVFTPEDLAPMMSMDSRGFRRLRPGAEGVLKLVLRGLSAGGRPKPSGLQRERVATLVAEDPEGARRAAALFGSGEAAVLAGMDALAASTWNQRAMLGVELRCLLRGVMEPVTAWRRVRSRLSRSNPCPVLHVLRRRGRTVPVDLPAWLAVVSTTDVVLGDAIGKRMV
jgi:hypothetical protein